MSRRPPAPDRIESTLRRFRETAKSAGVKLTPQRLEILRELATTEEHPDAETVLRAVRRRMPTVSLDTVYRTLWMLRDLGLATTLGPQRDAVRFDANLAPHHHYVCVTCGLVRDFDSAALDALRLPAEVARLGSVVTAQVEVRGRCARCAKASGTFRAARTRPRTRPHRSSEEPTS